MTEGDNLWFARKQIAQQQQDSETVTLCSAIRQDAIQLLSERGETRVSILDRISSSVLLGSLPFSAAIAIDPSLGDYTIFKIAPLISLFAPFLIRQLLPVSRAYQRFFESSQDKYIYEPIDSLDSKMNALVVANDGDPKRAKVVSIGILPSSEFLIMDKQRASIACTENDSRYPFLRSNNHFGVLSFNGEHFRMLRPANVEDAANYMEIIKKLGSSK